MITQEYLVGDLELRLTKSKPSDEIEVSYEQMAFWIDQARDEVTEAYIAGVKTIDSSIILSVPNLSLTAVDGKYKLSLGILPLNMKGRSGVISLVDEYGNYVNGQTQERRRINSLMAFTKPSNCTVVYTVEGTDIILDAGPEGYVELQTGTEYTAEIVPSELSRAKNPTDKYYIAPTTVDSVLELAEEIGLREINGRSTYDVSDDGLGNDIE